MHTDYKVLWFIVSGIESTRGKAHWKERDNKLTCPCNPCVYVEILSHHDVAQIGVEGYRVEVPRYAVQGHFLLAVPAKEPTKVPTRGKQCWLFGVLLCSVETSANSCSWLRTIPACDIEITTESHAEGQ